MLRWSLIFHFYDLNDGFISEIEIIVTPSHPVPESFFLLAQWCRITVTVDGYCFCSFCSFHFKYECDHSFYSIFHQKYFSEIFFYRYVSFFRTLPLLAQFLGVTYSSILIPEQWCRITTVMVYC